MKSIIQNTEQVKAILGGTRTVMRTAVKVKPPYSQNQLNERQNYRSEKDVEELAKKGSIALVGFWSPFSGYVSHKENKYQKGDIIYVRETCCEAFGVSRKYYYKAVAEELGEIQIYARSFNKWRSSVHMPFSAARIFLQVTDVRVERLQDITEEQAIKEGMNTKGAFKPKAYFQMVWNDKYSEKGYDWDSDCWVWVTEFKRISKQEAKGVGV